MKTFNTYIYEKMSNKFVSDKKKFDDLIKDINKLNPNNKAVKDVIAMLKQARDLKESFNDTIHIEQIATLLNDNNIEG